MPSVDSVVRSESLRPYVGEFRRDLIVRLARAMLEIVRADAMLGSPVPTPEEVARSVAERIRNEWVAAPGHAINATGVILHTNLARAPLSSQAKDAIRAASGYSALELDLVSGSRGDRQTHVSRQLAAITGAESAFVTVNAASAVLLALTALARRREVIVSRGQSVEIGGGFRIPDVLQQSGAKMVEVGTTNRTRLDDYQAALSNRTAAILHVHLSNFRLTGFVQSVPLEDLAALARDARVPLIDDNGSGALLDTGRFGLAHEPTVQESLEAGSELVAFSGDKLMGGPQCGILLGRRDLIAKIAKHPLARALRPDKIILAALSATAVAYLRDDAASTIPVWQMISATAESLETRASAFARSAATVGITLTTLPGESTVGGGSLPGESLPTTLLAMPSYVTTEHLRAAVPPIIARAHDGKTVLDLRTVATGEESALLAGIAAACAGRSRSTV